MPFRAITDGEAFVFESGTSAEFHDWYTGLLREASRDYIPQLFAAAYVGVSAAAVNKRIRSGALSLHTFSVHRTPSDPVSHPQRSFHFLRTSELDAWIYELQYGRGSRNA